METTIKGISWSCNSEYLAIFTSNQVKLVNLNNSKEIVIETKFEINYNCLSWSING